jgi:hypothetical protein
MPRRRRRRCHDRGAAKRCRTPAESGGSCPPMNGPQAHIRGPHHGGRCYPRSYSRVGQVSLPKMDSDGLIPNGTLNHSCRQHGTKPDRIETTHLLSDGPMCSALEHRNEPLVVWPHDRRQVRRSHGCSCRIGNSGCRTRACARMSGRAAADAARHPAGNTLSDQRDYQICWRQTISATGFR